MVTDIEGHNVAMFGFWVRDFAFGAPPLARLFFDDFFIAVSREASRIGKIILFDVDDGCFGGEVVRRLGHS